MKRFASDEIIMELQMIHKELHELNQRLDTGRLLKNHEGDDPGIPGISADFVDDLKKISPKSC
ncbi:hypothetical protein [Lacticaseibacillus sp. N501-2]|uniref:hypothetical protein n=1 Tax=Lacticaseibacillus salsurae TaxID=3367729 RepID=UPI0038B4148C